jgi:aspartate carbamoyltransferase catalytic subunit
MKVDMIVLRHPNPGSSLLLSQYTDSCIVNAGDGSHEHPTQALLDSFSLYENLEDLKGKNILIVGDILHSRVALSNIYVLNLLGANVKLSCPLSLVPKDIEKLNLSVETDIIKALKWCDAVNVLRVQRERMLKSYFPNNREYSMLFGLDINKLNKIKKDILILHPGPINRGVEITSDIVESNNSIILDQVENGVAIRMAIIYLLASKMNFTINE